MKTTYFILILLFSLTINAQGIEDLEFGTENSFEVLTWNIEQFPKNGNTTVDYVIDIIEALDVDVLALQEISDIDTFNAMVDQLSPYEGYLESIWFGGLAYIYKSDTIEINAFYEIYTTSEYWNYFPRSPMVMELTYLGEEFILINNHFKCCGDGLLDVNNDNDEETRRYFASTLLKEYIDSNWEDKNVILLGDLNDDLTDTEGNNVFQMFLDDATNYLFTDYEIASGSSEHWSFPNWPSHLDHILITNELFEAFNNANAAVQTIKIDDYLPGGWNEYDSNISDHRPVALKLITEGNLNTSNTANSKNYFSNYPNPAITNTTFRFQSLSTPTHLEIYTIHGQIVGTYKIKPEQKKLTMNTSFFSNGFYIAKLYDNNSLLDYIKLIVIN